MSLNYDILQAAPLTLPTVETIRFYLIGCGGTGSWLAPTLARLSKVLGERKSVELIFIDPDLVEEINTIRQNFCSAEIGLPKAQTLALRYSLAWGVEIKTLTQPFSHTLLKNDFYRCLTFLIGCVDNAAARNDIAQTLNHYQSNYNKATYLWWLDCGNHATSGQILLGSHLQNDPNFYQFHELGCSRLPAPCVQHPDLLIPKREETDNHNLSCEQLALLNTQSLGINQRVATEAAQYLIGLTTGQLNRFATYFDLIGGCANSKYITQKTIEQSIQSPPNQKLVLSKSSSVAPEK